MKKNQFMCIALRTGNEFDCLRCDHPNGYDCPVEKLVTNTAKRWTYGDKRRLLKAERDYGIDFMNLKRGEVPMLCELLGYSDSAVRTHIKEVLKERAERRIKHREISRRYRQSHKEMLKDKRKEYYEANKERLNVLRQEYREAHRERDREINRAFHQAHKEKCNAKSRKYYEDHREVEKAKRRKYYTEHREEIIARRNALKTSKEEMKGDFENGE